MGDYPVLPAKVLETGEELHKFIDERQEELLGKDCAEKFGGVLPFLPKVSPPISQRWRVEGGLSICGEVREGKLSGSLVNIMSKNGFCYFLNHGDL